MIRLNIMIDVYFVFIVFYCRIVEFIIVIVKCVIFMICDIVFNVICNMYFLF